MTKRRWTILLGVVLFAGGLLWAFVGREPVGDGRARLQRRAVGNPAKNRVVELAWQMLEPELTRPQEIRDLPKGFAKPCFYHVQIDGASVAVALDMSRGKLWIDADRDGLLSNERSYQAKSVKLTPRGDRRWRFGPIRVSVRADEKRPPVVFYALRQAADLAVPLSIYPAHYRSGRLRIDGRLHHVAMVDGDYDGRFDSVVSLPANSPWRWTHSDVFAIDSDRNGRFEVALYARPSEVMPLSRMVLVGGHYCAIDVSADGRELGLRPVEPERGRLAVEPADAELQLRLWSDAADQCLSSTGGSWDLPAGTYQTLYAILGLKDPNGNTWRVSMPREAGALTSFAIRAGETTSLRIGPPFTVQADVRKPEPGTVTITPLLTGCAGEVYDVPMRTFFKIVDEKGTVMAGDRFEHG